MENNIEQKPNKIVSHIKTEDYESKMYYGTKEDGTLYWGYETIEINGEKIEASKRKVTLYRQTTQLEQQLYHMPFAMPKTIKTIYEMPIELYDKIPEIVKINDKNFYKTDIEEINQTHFKLIEM